MALAGFRVIQVCTGSLSLAPLSIYRLQLAVLVLVPLALALPVAVPLWLAVPARVRLPPAPVVPLTAGRLRLTDSLPVPMSLSHYRTAEALQRQWYCHFSRGASDTATASSSGMLTALPVAVAGSA